METKWLETFVAASRAGSLSGAATELSYARSTVTGHIQQLEAAVGASLFDRDGNTASVSRAGEVLLTHAPDLLERLARAVERTREAGESTPLRFGATDFGCCYHVPPLMKRIRRDVGHVEMRVTADRADRLSDRLTGGDLDVALVPRATDGAYVPSPVTSRFLREKVIRREPLVLVSSADTVETTHTVLVGQQGCVCRTATERDLLRGDRAGYRLLEVSSLEAVRASAVSGLGLAVVPLMMVRPELDSGRLVRLPWRSSLSCVLTLQWRTDRATPQVHRTLDMMSALR